MKYKIASLFFMIVLALAFSSTKPGRAIEQSVETKSDQPAVRFAIAPIFIPWKFNDVGMGKAVVEVKVNAAGEVIAAKCIEGSPDFPWGDLSFAETAKLWRFAPVADETQERILRITFVQRIVPKGSPWRELAPRYIAPYQMETRHEVFEPPTNEDPQLLPDKKERGKRP
jgi:hypothetical protein